MPASRLLKERSISSSSGDVDCDVLAELQRMTDEGQHMPSVLQVTRHVPHLRVAEPVIQYFRINQGDWKSGRPVIDARNSVPVYGYVIFHDGRKSLRNIGERNC